MSEASKVVPFRSGLAESGEFESHREDENEIEDGSQGISPPQTHNAGFLPPS